MSKVTIASVYADLLGTYGDAGNVITLVHRARLRGIEAEVISVQPGDPLPTLADIYVLGGGEDTAQVAAAEALRRDGALRTAADRGATILAICAGYQLLGEYFPDAEGKPSAGLDLINITTARLPGPRAVGELAVEPLVAGRTLLTRDRFTGYENHAGGTTRGAGVEPLGRVLSGIGNGDGTEGSIVGHVVGTYLHGPCLVRNPDIADQLLAWGTGAELRVAIEAEVEDLRAERFRTVLDK